MNVKSLLIALFALAAVGTAGSISLGSFSMSSGATFLQQSGNDNCSYATHSAQCIGPSFFTPTVVDLVDNGINPGDTLSITIAGTLCYLPSVCVNPNLGGIFSSTGIGSLLNSTNLQRVPNAVNSGLSSHTTTTYFNLAGTGVGPVDNTNPFDFMIPFGVTFHLVVPNAANFLFIGTYDSFSADNSGNVTITVNATTIDPPPSTPEPATYVLVGAGLAATLALRKRFV